VGLFGGDFSFADSVADTFSNAFTLFQIGAQVLGESEKETDYSSFVKKHRFTPAQTVGRPMYPQQMEAPVGLRGPSLQTAMKYFADNPPSDVNFQSIRTQSYVAKAPRYTSTKPTMTISDANTITGRKQSVNVSGVMSLSSS